MKNLFNIIFQSIISLTLIFTLLFTAYFFDLVLNGIQKPETLEIMPYYQNPVGKMAKKCVLSGLEGKNSRVSVKR